MNKLEKDFFINEINNVIENYNFTSLLIGCRSTPEIQVLAEANNFKIIFGRNYDNYDSVQIIMEYFIEKGIKKDNRYTLNEGIGLYLRENI